MNYIVFVLAMIVMVGSACHRRVIVRKTPVTHRLPPGQAKKVTGSKSARAYAPGHQKKH